MSNYLSNLAATVVHPGRQVRPRLPGRFESHRQPGPFDWGAGENVGPTADGVEEPAAPADGAHPSGDLIAPSENAPRRGRVRPAKALSAPSEAPEPPASQVVATPLEAPEPSAGQGLPQRSKTARPKARRGTPELPQGVPTDPRAAGKPPYSETGKGPADPGRTEPVSPAPLPDASPAAEDQSRRPLSEDIRPSPRLTGRLRPDRLQPSPAEPAAAPQARTAPTFEPSAPLRIPADSQPGQSPPAAPILGSANGIPLIEPRLAVSPAEVPSPRAGVQPTPIRVTIGRIEVRAALPQPLPQPARPVRRQPALPLEQYLQRRNEGRS